MYRNTPEYERLSPLEKWTARLKYQQGLRDLSEHAESERDRAIELAEEMKRSARARATCKGA